MGFIILESKASLPLLIIFRLRFIDEMGFAATVWLRKKLNCISVIRSRECYITDRLKNIIFMWKNTQNLIIDLIFLFIFMHMIK